MTCRGISLPDRCSPSPRASWLSLRYRCNAQCPSGCHGAIVPANVLYRSGGSRNCPGSGARFRDSGGSRSELRPRRSG